MRRGLKCYTAKLMLIVAFIPFGFMATNTPSAAQVKLYAMWYSEDAVSQMTQYKIPASVILAQAIFESYSGHSELAKRSNNHFGIKCHIEWGGDTIVKTDDTLNECFRKYRSVEDSYTDHSLFLKSRSRYAFLFDIPVTDYKAWCYGLKNAGYATYPCYAEELIKIIEENKLYELDRPEKLKTGYQVFNKNTQLVKSNFDTRSFSASGKQKAEYLFCDFMDVPIQSLELIIGADEEEVMVAK